MPMHDGQLDLDAATARALVDGQFPHWQSLPLVPVPSDGTVNLLFRLGDQLALRFPLQGDDPETVRIALASEAAASAELAEAVSIDAPRPVAIGQPGLGYPLPWSVQTWVEGEVATQADVASSDLFATDIATLISELRQVPVNGRRFSGQGRGGSITAHGDWVELCLAKSQGLLDVTTLQRLWERYRELPETDDLAMTHGDLMPGNLLLRDDRLAAVIDNGGFAPADPALDLVSCWHLVEAGPRELIRERLGSSALEWARGQAWAFVQSIGLVWYYQQSNPVMAQIGRTTLERIIAAPAVDPERSRPRLKP